jgi:hypothetical protein
MNLLEPVQGFFCERTIIVDTMQSIACNLSLCNEKNFNIFWRIKMFFDKKAVQVIPIHNGDGSVTYVPVVIPSQEKGKGQDNKEPYTPNKKS